MRVGWEEGGSSGWEEGGGSSCWLLVKHRVSLITVLEEATCKKLYFRSEICSLN